MIQPGGVAASSGIPIGSGVKDLPLRPGIPARPKRPGALPGLPDTKVRVCCLVASFQVEGHREVGGGPQGECRQRLTQHQRRGPEQEVLRFLFVAEGPVGYSRAA